MSVFMKTMAAKNPISALKKEESGPGDKIKQAIKSLSCPNGQCRPKGWRKEAKRLKKNKTRYNKKR